jgi:hypothetical protein
MNVIIADQIAREHTQSLLADAANARLVRQARQGRKGRSARRAARSGDPAQQPAPSGRRSARSGAAVAHFVGRPFLAFQGWVAAGEL